MMNSDNLLGFLFKYAYPQIPKEKQYAVLFYWIGQVDKGEDPALALFWPIHKLIKEAK